LWCGERPVVVRPLSRFSPTLTIAAGEGQKRGAVHSAASIHFDIRVAVWACIEEGSRRVNLRLIELSLLIPPRTRRRASRRASGNEAHSARQAIDTMFSANATMNGRALPLTPPGDGRRTQTGESHISYDDRQVIEVYTATRSGRMDTPRQIRDCALRDGRADALSSARASPCRRAQTGRFPGGGPAVPMGSRRDPYRYTVTFEGRDRIATDLAPSTAP